MLDIHDTIAQREELARGERFRKEVREIVGRLNEGDHELHVLDAFAHEVVATLDVLGPLMMFRIVREIDRGGVIHEQRDRRVGGETELLSKSTKVNCLLRRLRCRHQLRAASSCPS